MFGARAESLRPSADVRGFAVHRDAALDDHLLGGLRGGLGGDGQTLAHLRDLDHVRLEVGELAAGTSVEGRVRGDAGEAAPAHGFLDLVDVCGVDKELHDVRS